MEYLYGKDGNFEDFSSGRVFYGGKGVPNFPVRLLNEIFGRAKAYGNKTKDLVLYDPCCGGGYLLSVLGFFHNDVIKKIYGSDADENMVEMAKKNTSLLTGRGLDNRKKELENLYEEFRKASHQGAMESCDRLRDILKNEIGAEIFQADCTENLPRILPDIIIVDIPYGSLTEWNEPMAWNLEKMMDRLWEISQEETVLAICMDKRQKCHSAKWVRLEKNNIGKRRFEIYKKPNIAKQDDQS